MGIFSLFIKYQLLNYFRAIGQALLANWQWVFLIAGFLAPVIDVPSLVKPITIIITHHNAVLDDVFYLILYQLFSIFWIQTQKSAIQGGHFYPYLSTLPIPGYIVKSVHLVTIIIANNILWILFFLALTTATQQSPQDTLQIVIYASALMIGSLNLQLQWLHNRVSTVLLFLILEALLITINLESHAIYEMLTLAVLLSLSIFFIFYSLPKQYDRILRGFFRHFFFSNIVKNASIFYRFPIIGLQSKVLFTDNRVKSFSKIAFVLATLMFAYSVLIYGKKFDITFEILLIATCTSSLLFSGLYRNLEDAHVKCRPYLTSLPIHQFFWAFRDTFYIVTMQLILTTPLLLYFLINGFLSISSFVNIILTSVILMVTLRFVIVNFSNHAVFVTSTLTITWISMGLLINKL